MQLQPNSVRGARRSFGLAGLYLLAGLVLCATGCQSFNSPPTANSLTSAIIRNKTLLQIAAATQSVFASHYFHGGQTAPGKFTFERPGSRMNDLAYSSAMFNETVTVRVVVTINRMTAYEAIVACNAWLVEAADDPVFEDNHKVRHLRKWPYEQLLKDIQTQLGE